MPRLLRSLITLALALWLGGCFLTSLSPLVPASQAHFDIEDGFWEVCELSDGDCSIVSIERRSGGLYQYVQSTGTAFLFRLGPPGERGLRIVQLHGVDAYRYAAVRQTATGWRFTGLNCNNPYQSDALAEASMQDLVCLNQQNCWVTGRTELEMVLHALDAETGGSASMASDYRLLGTAVGQERFVEAARASSTRSLERKAWTSFVEAAGIVYREGSDEDRQAIRVTAAEILPEVLAWNEEGNNRDVRETTAIWAIMLAGDVDAISTLRLSDDSDQSVTQMARVMALSIMAYERFGLTLLFDNCRALQTARAMHLRLPWPTSAWQQYAEETTRCPR